MRYLAIILVFVPMISAQEIPEDSAGKVDRKDYTEFSRLVHKMVVPQVPRFYEDMSQWGQTIPLPADLRFPRLRRTVVEVNGRPEVPHGIWKKYRVWIDEPAEDVQVNIRDMHKTEGNAYRINLELEAVLHGSGEVQPWQKGLGLPVVKAEADIVVNLQMDVDVKLTLNTTKFPPDVTVEPWIAASKLEIRDFHLKKIGSIVTLEGEGVGNLGNDLRGTLNDLVRSREEEITDRVNQAISQSLREGKGTLSAASMMKLFSAK